MTDLPHPDAIRAAPDIRFHLPAEPLRPFVTSYYVLEAHHPLDDFTHPEWANIRFAMAGEWLFYGTDGSGPTVQPNATLFGPTDRTRRFTTERAVALGVGLTPVGWLALIGSDASDAANEILPLGMQLGVAGLDLYRDLVAAPDEAAQVAMLDRVLTARVRHPSSYYATAAAVQAALLSGEVDQVGDLADTLGVEQRTLHRVCTSVFGFSPVRLLRRQRFLRTLGRVRDMLDQPLGQVIDSQYYDQAHFNRDFKAYMGMTPLAYFRLPREAMRRAVEERRRVLGAPVQGLHVNR